MRFVAVLDGSSGGAERRARALGAFVRDGLKDAPDGAAGESLLFYADGDDPERLVESAPTADVRLVKVPPRRPDVVTAALTALSGSVRADLFLFHGGPAGTESAVRLSQRTGGALLTGALSLAAGSDGLLGRCSVYSGHMTGQFLLSTRPWCVTVDAAWEDADAPPPVAHRVLSEGVADHVADEPPFTDLELGAPPAAGDLTGARFVVVAGNGAGGRDGVARIATAAARMGAAFAVSRPVAMNAWAPVDRLVGVSGARIAPAACLVAGASGAPAFLWGIERSGVIIAVNTDEHAPIARAADAVVRDDAVAVVEALADVVAGDPDPR